MNIKQRTLALEFYNIVSAGTTTRVGLEISDKKDELFVHML